MSIKVYTEISNEYEDIEVIINTNQLTPDVQKLIELVQNIDTSLEKIIASKDNDIFILDTKDIICFFSEDKRNYCRTNKGICKIKETLYKLEERLSPENFIRISNSCIINISHVECFNTGMVGTIKVRFKDGKVEYVSRRRISKVMQQLKRGI